MKLHIFAVCFLYCLPNMYPQANYYFGIFGMENQDFQRTYVDDRINLDKSISRSFGIIAGKTMGKYWAIETGIISKPYNHKSYPANLKYKPPFDISSKSFQAIQIPLRATLRIPIVSQRLLLNPKVGLSLLFNTNYQDTHTFSDRYQVSLTSYSLGTVERKTFTEKGLIRNTLMTELGVDFEFLPHPRFSVLVNGSFFRSYSDDISHQKTTYQINDGLPQEVDAFINGDYLNLGVGIKYCIVPEG